MIVKTRFLIIMLLSMFALLWKGENTCDAQPEYQFSPPTQVTLRMRVLKANGEIDSSLTDSRCYSIAGNHTKYGCTYFDGVIGPSPVKAYPFTSDTITIGIEDHTRNDLQQGYLRNVVPQELDPSHPDSAVMGQAITSRTYLYRQILDGNSLNNSSQFQVYLPYRYEALPSNQKDRVDRALEQKIYMSTPGSDEPIKAYFGQDNDEYTTKGDASYLKSIYDPISEEQGEDVGTGYGGMGSRAAARWASGNEDWNGHGDAWSVCWDSGLQLPCHFFSEVVFIGASPAPPNEYRFNVLKISGMPEHNRLRKGKTYQVEVWLQNTGTNPWPVHMYNPAQSIYCPDSGDKTNLSYHYYQRYNPNQVSCQNATNSCFEGARTVLCLYNFDTLDIGSSIQVSKVWLTTPEELPIGEHWLRWDIVHENDTWGSRLQLNPSQAQWPTQDVLVEVVPAYGNIDGVSSIDHTPGQWSNDATLAMTWDATPTTDYYRYRWEPEPDHPSIRHDDNSWACGDGWRCTDDTAVTTVLPDGRWTFEVYSVADDGETNEVVRRGPFKIDTTAPTALLSFNPAWVTSTSFPVDWSGSYDDSGSGNLHFDLDYRTHYELNPAAPWSEWVRWQTDTSATSGTFDNAIDDTLYQFRLTVRDEADNENTNYAAVSVRTQPYLAIGEEPAGLLNWTIIYSDTQPRTGYLRIANEGGGTLDWNLDQDSTFPWLEVGQPTSSSGSLRANASWLIPMTLTHSSDIGLYTTTLTVTAAGNARRTPVVLKATIRVVEHSASHPVGDYDQFLPVIFKEETP